MAHAYYTVRGRFIEGRDLWKRLNEETERSKRAADNDAVVERLSAIRRPTSTWTDVSYLRELIAHLILDEAFRGLRRDVVLVLAGLACGLAADVWSAWLP